MLNIIDKISPEQTVLIAGPTAAGKSALALEIATRQGGVIVNADALQVYQNWRILTARPSVAEESLAPHQLYGHVAADTAYSVGSWLRDVIKILKGPKRAIIVGGTGLYFRALLEGLVDIPATPDAIRLLGDTRRLAGEIDGMLAELDPVTQARIDVQNPVRIQRAWEVQATTGRGLAIWQDETPAPTISRNAAFQVVLDADKDWLSGRISQRFDLMLKQGVLAEAGANQKNWDPALPSAKAIGAAELIAHLRGEMSLEAASDSAKIASRQYAKRQRTWFRARMQNWDRVDLP